MPRAVMIAVTLALTFVPNLPAAEIDFVEDYVLAEDRAAALQTLIPGSEDYYYYHCLHYQATEQFEKADELLTAWIKRYNYTPRVYEIENRQALLTYDRTPQRSLALIRKRLRLQFNHQQDRIGETSNLPSELPASSISRKRLTERALRRYENLAGFEDRALQWLAESELNPVRRRHLLERLTKPDQDNLVSLIIADLQHRGAKPFGSLAIHTALLPSQLDELARRLPEVVNQNEYVTIYISKLRPNNDTNWRHDPDARRAYLNRLWDFVAELAPAHNSLKAHVLYHLLDAERQQGIFNRARFLTYLQLPRRVDYAARPYLERPQHRRFLADLNSDFVAVTQLPVVGNDKPLVRNFFQHFFVTETTTKPFEPFVDNTFLRHQFAEAKIVNGLGDAERWYSMLPPAKYQALKDRIDLEFAVTNQRQFKPHERVTLDLYVKNVSKLLVKVYEINTSGYYRQHAREVPTDINLDGLVANEELTFNYREPPLRRIRRRFEFPNLSERGVFVIDFIGNGLNSRAVIRKGHLQHLVRNTTAGHAFTVLDEEHHPVSKARIWIAGQEYLADEEGVIYVPYSTSPGKREVVISQGDFSALGTFFHAGESYDLQAGFYIDRETLLTRETAKLLVRPKLMLNGTPVSVQILEHVRLRITSTDQMGVVATQEISDFELFDDRETIHTLQVPPRLVSLQFELHASVPLLSTSEDAELAAESRVELNQIAATEHVDDLHLARAANGYRLELLGRTGEQKSDRPVKLVLKHSDFRDPVEITLQTDSQGQIALGRLPSISSLTATGPSGVPRNWPLKADRRDYAATITGIAGERLEVPVMVDVEQVSPAAFSLLELRGSTYVADRLDAVQLRDGMLVIEGLGAGDYELSLKEQAVQILLRLVAGESQASHAVGRDRIVEIGDTRPLQIKPLRVADGKLRIEVLNRSRHTRVHLFATHLQPAYSLYDQLVVAKKGLAWRNVNPILSAYSAGRNIGDEYQYIIDRKYAPKFPGVMLDRPRLLLNPWSLRETDSSEQQARQGNPFAAATPPAADATGARDEQRKSDQSTSDFSDLDFLRRAAFVVANLTPNEQGLIELPLESLQAYQQVHVAALDTRTTVVRSLTLPAEPTEVQDLRLLAGLDPGEHFAQQRSVSMVAPGEAFLLEDISSSRFEIYDSLAKIYALFATIRPDSHLAEFRFILDWPELSTEERRKRYSEYACHELHFFLARKDPEFFRQVVDPYLAHKKDKTFLDRWLLGRSVEDALQPWSYQRLNVAEQILLGQRVEGQLRQTRRDLIDRLALLPDDIDRQNQLFQLALATRSLDANDELGLAAALGAVAEAEVEEGAMGGGAGARYFGEMQLGRRSTKAMPAELADRLRRNRVNESLRLADDAALSFSTAEAAREVARQLYETVDKTREWAENNYYQLPIEEQNADLVQMNRFWRDYVRHEGGERFFSPAFPEATRNFTEMMLTLSVLDLPFQSPEHEITYDGRSMRLTAKGPLLVFHEEIRKAEPAEQPIAILVSQNFFRRDDRYRHEGNERHDKFVRDEFLVQTVYGCQIVVTNPTSSSQKLNLLLQIPTGAIPVLRGRQTKSEHMELSPFSTKTVEYFFYFPVAGRFPHYPVHVTKHERFVASGEPLVFEVVEQLSRVDRDSWEYISQQGSEEQVLAFLREANLHRVELSKIAFRMRNRAFFLDVVETLRERRVYDHTLWSYSVQHNHPPSINTFLRHAEDFVTQCGMTISSPLLQIDPVARGIYQHTDFHPLINARAHQLGRRRQIVNDRLHEKYHQLLKLLSYRKRYDSEDQLALTYYLLLQDRVSEAMVRRQSVVASDLETRLQLDYFDAYLAMAHEEPLRAKQIAENYTDYPVNRWRDAFAAIVQQLNEIEGSPVEIVDEGNREQRQAQLTETEPSLEFELDAQQVTVRYQHLDEVEINYYLMDIELLFSRNPFVQQYSKQFSHIRPNQTDQINLPADGGSYQFELPEELRHRNVLVELRGNGVTRSRPYYSNALSVQLVENYGRLRVTNADTGEPLAKVYVKVYARLKDGRTQFYKDGYTDLRGRLDYASLSTNQLDFVDRFAILVFSDEYGAVVREATPPLR